METAAYLIIKHELDLKSTFKSSRRMREMFQTKIRETLVDSRSDVAVIKQI